MQKQAPTLGRILVMAGFALSCFGLLLYLWISFGGSTPLKPKGYQFHAYFPEAAQLAQQADVRISGVPVGKVVKLELGPGNTTNATLQLDERYAPIPKDARAILRQKTLLGETYVELTPGNKSAGLLREGGALKPGQVQRTVELDEIFRSLDDKTRRDFQVWMQSTAAGLRGRGQDFNDALGNLAPFAENTTDLLRILDRQRPAVQGLVKNSAVVFDALAGRNGELRDLISNSNTVFATVGDRNASLQALFKALPTFERESQMTVERLDQFARETDPLVRQLQPVAQELSPTLQSLSRLAPPFRDFFVDLGPLITASYRGLPAFTRFLDDLRPALGQLDPFTRTLNPVLKYISAYLPEIDAFFGNFTVAANGIGGDRPGYLRGTAPITPEVLGIYPRRLAYNRGNPYRSPGTADELVRGLASFETRQCTDGLRPVPNLPANLPEIIGGIGADAAAFLQTVAFRVEADPPGSNNIVSGSYADVPAPPCRLQGRFPGFAGDYPHVVADPPTRP
ncbi:MlaD family protein [Conexibacter sp. JD483]|uniref:MCE family protein n=1 Tax=unclassified Conexibacter TaxID=2627773 RepID=UPI002716D5B7|nr:MULTISPECIES: MlaD family protein [unclassified Conexibacter]MDO8186156.1 MlaD family protein [Conexibacter sp. CPCC 205706]MDO8199646.1 MlaD family protein [Conexibacter sp. CPCC 205762]MDR9369100.1 MlaD family protein [Conexibacter sp. JD483]